MFILRCWGFFLGVWEDYGMVSYGLFLWCILVIVGYWSGG